MRHARFTGPAELVPRAVFGTAPTLYVLSFMIIFAAGPKIMQVDAPPSIGWTVSQLLRLQAHVTAHSPIPVPEPHGFLGRGLTS